jgi:hypothetical protein
MSDENYRDETLRKKNILYRFDRLIQGFIPNFNARAILYLSVMFAIAVYVQLWRFSSPSLEVKPVAGIQETVIADTHYWSSKAYAEKLQQQTIDSFTQELTLWLAGTNQEFSKRKFEDMLFINRGFTAANGESLTTIVPEVFNYLENTGKARYQYAQVKGFLSATPTLVKLGTLVCNIDSATEQVTDIELYDWRYASMPKLSVFMNTKPDWKMQIGSKIFDVSDPRIEDKDILKLRTVKTQPPGLFSFLIFRNPQTNRIALADSAMLDMNGVDAKLTLSRIGSQWNKQSKLYFQYGYEGCKQMNNITPINYGQSD